MAKAAASLKVEEMKPLTMASMDKFRLFYLLN